MPIKVYEKIQIFIKENIKQIIIFLFLFLLVTVPIPSLYICTGGGITSIDNRIEIENKVNNKDENLYMAYVSELKATIPFLMIALVNPNWNIEKYINTNSSEEDIRGEIYLNNSLDNSIIVAYNKANKPVKILDYNHKILFIDKNINSNILVGDEILLVDNYKINNINDYINVVNKKEVGDFILLTIKRDSKQFTEELPVRMVDGRKITGINFVTNYKYETNPKINIKFDSSESGPSGGMMIALSIYDNLVDNKLTNGRKIVGTGAIDNKGNVLEIGGVEYKFKAAVKGKTDIFIVPSGSNYEKVMEIQKEKNYNIKIIEVSTFDELIKKLSI